MDPYVSQFKSAVAASAGDAELDLIIRADTADVHHHPYSAPVSGEEAALLPCEDIAAPCDVVIQNRSGNLQRIIEPNAATSYCTLF